MRFAIAFFGLAIVGLAGWMLLDLRSATPKPVPVAATPAEPPAPPPVRTLAPPLPIASPTGAPERPIAPNPGNAPNAPEADDPVASGNPMDQVKMGKTLREWRHYYGERQRAIQEEMYKNEDVLDRAEGDDPPSAAQQADARAHLEELKARMRSDLVELRKIESSP
jgi:hypothetical protein